MKTDVIVRSFGLLAVLGCLVLPATAQPGSTILSPVDLDAQTGNNGHLGCVELGGAFYVSGRRLTTTDPHQVYVVDGVGTVINQYDQDPATATSAWGYRDGATDCTSLMWGNEPGIFVTDPSTGALVNTVEAANGTQALAANPITGPGLAAIGNYRALAFDPDGNGGNGSFWSGNFGSDLYEVDLDGNILTQHANGGYSLYGLVLDPVTGRLWGHSSSGAIVEIDKSTGATTGRTWTSPAGAGAQGGLSRVKSSLHKLDLCGVMQGDPSLGGVVDSLFSVQVHRLCSGTALLAGRVDNGPAQVFGTQGYFTGQLLTWEYDTGITDSSVSGAGVLLGLNIGADAAANGNTIGLPDIVLVNNFSVPAGTAGFLADGIGGGSLAGLLGVDLTGFGLGLPTLVGGVPVGVSGPALASVGDEIRLQAVYEDTLGFGGVAATNEIRFRWLGAPPCIVVSATGSNSFNSDTSEGYWKVEHLGGCASIVKVTFDWTDASVPASQATMEFDTDQTSMADVPNGGNSAVAGCLGTYRNGSDAATGLIYAAGQTSPACDPTALSGFIGTNQVGTSPDFKTVEFNFTPGTFQNATLEWDCDTDGGAGIGGDDMAGMFVRIELSDSTVFTGNLAVDPNTSNRSVVSF